MISRLEAEISELGEESVIVAICGQSHIRTLIEHFKDKD